MNVHSVLDNVERVKVLDAPAGAASRLVSRLVGTERMARALRGSWLGHPVHPLLVTLPIGTWVTSAVFDVVFKDVTAARQEQHRAARVCTVLGLTAISVGGALGGHLSYAQGAGVFRWQPLRGTIHHSPIEYQRAA